MNSEIGKKAMREYDTSIRRDAVLPIRGKKQGGKIKPVTEVEIEIK